MDRIHSTTRAPSRSPPPTVVTLDGRPERPRAQNEYVDTPLPNTNNTPKATTIVARDRYSRSGGGGVISSQPTSVAPSLKKDIDVADRSTTNGNSGNLDTIYCSRCGKCRCKACTQPRELPDTWVCGQHLSADNVVDVCSCLCCVKCVFYHLFKDSELDDDVTSAADPCACCDRRHCCGRWSCIALMSLCLPCLWCYPPLRCAVAVLTDCYNCCHRQGCRCRRERKPSGTKRLLLESESSSS
jgi:hypothetical protein